MALIKCPKCQNSVSDRATICPHCGKKLKIAITSYCVECGSELKKEDKICKACGFPVYNNIVHKKPSKPRVSWKTVLISCTLSCIVSLSAIGGTILYFANTMSKSFGGKSLFTSEQTSAKSTKNQKNSDNTKTDFSVGEVAEYNGIQMSVSGFKTSSGSELSAPQSGNTFVFVNMEITNTSNEEISISSMASFDIYCNDYKLEYSTNALFSASENNYQQLDGSVAPGKKLNGYLAMEVPENWKSIEVMYKDNIWAGSNFKFIIANA